MNTTYKKVDPYLFSLVTTCGVQKPISCVIYANNYQGVKKFFSGFKFFNDQNFYEYPFIKAFGIKLMPDKINKVAQNKHIKYVTASTKVFAQINVAKKVTNINSLHEKGYLGKGVTMAIIDTGVTPHLDFVFPENRIVMFKDFIKNKNKPYDDNGHGTFVTGVASGNGLISNAKYSGVAPLTNIISLKTLDSKGETGAFTILQAMQWVYDNHKKYNIKVVCMSFGSNPLGGSDPLSMGAEALWHEGITVVAAAGNSGPDNSSIKSPGTSARIITVGALDDKRKTNGKFASNDFAVADFSSRGPVANIFKPDILAPGVNLTSTSNDIDENYTKLSGTSVATPIIAGLCCLIIEKYPDITPDEIKGLLINNSKPISNDKNSEGYGLIDAEELFDL